MITLALRIAVLGFFLTVYLDRYRPRSRPRGRHTMNSLADDDVATLELFHSLNARSRLLNTRTHLLRSIHGMASSSPASRRAAMMLLCAINDAAAARVLTARYIAAGRYITWGTR